MGYQNKSRPKKISKDQLIKKTIYDAEWQYVNFGKHIAATDLLVSLIDNLLLENDFNSVNKLLDLINVTKFGSTVLTGILFMTLPFKKELSNRVDFVKKAFYVLEQSMSEDRLLAIKKRLE